MWGDAAVACERLGADDERRIVEGIPAVEVAASSDAGGCAVAGGVAEGVAGDGGVVNVLSVAPAAKVEAATGGGFSEASTRLVKKPESFSRSLSAAAGSGFSALCDE